MTGQRVLVGLLATTFGVAGVGKLLRTDPMRDLFDRWGVSQDLLPIVGAIEVAGAALLLSRRTRRVAAPILGAVAGSAVVAQLRAGDPVPVVLPLLEGAALAAVGRKDAAVRREMRWEQEPSSSGRYDPMAW